ncbi:MAG TPA: energy-coupling factor transporter ATPase [Candidatus Alectryocaccomicrobium excrementavium]|uniref:Energy-coupling factor transporter ATP-binding protein EcfA2 n=1 Tax=Candidatus Alectryocaccomicrobium excrementavium TaxID=2840668 RepID=A0A9D1FY57_9FIRM|nr:energy-coupling factor transporter ATPase [Candidatus Alectryocaccomicrobium excrementavium]
MPIEVVNATYIYMPGTPFETRALDGVSLSIADGEFVGIIGHTGSGKSTLVQHLNALLKPTLGSVYVNGLNLNDKDANLRDVRRAVGLVFQYPEYQLFEETVRKDIAFGPNNLGLEAADVEARVREAAQIVGLSEDLLDRSPFELSGGQKRRVAIAGVLAMRPNVLVLDEPAAGLDPRGRREMLALVRDYHARGGVTVIMVSHSMDDVARMCSRIIVMNHGRVAFDAPPAQVFAHGDELAAMGLGIPACAQLANRLREKGFAIPKGVFALEELAGAITACLGAEGEDGHA